MPYTLNECLESCFVSLIRNNNIVVIIITVNITVYQGMRDNSLSVKEISDIKLGN